MAPKRGKLILTNYGKRRLKTTRHRVTPELQAISGIMDHRCEEDPFSWEFKVRWERHHHAQDTWKPLKFLMNADENTREAVMGYFAVRYEGKKFVLVEPEDNGRLRYSVVDLGSIFKHINKTDTKARDHRVSEPQIRAQTPAPSPEYVSTMPTVSQITVGEKSSPKPHRAKKNAKRLEFVQPWYSLDAQRGSSKTKMKASKEKA